MARRTLKRTLAIDPTREGFAYVLLEESALLDWGQANIHSKQDRDFVARVFLLVDKCRPHLLVLEGPEGSRRGDRARRRLHKTERHAALRKLPVAIVTRPEMRERFSHVGKSKWEIARALASRYPELEWKLPPRRKPWQSEDERMNIFDALSMAVTALESQ